MARANGRTTARDLCRDLGLDLAGIDRGDRSQITKLERTFGRTSGELFDRAIRRFGTRHVRLGSITFPTTTIAPSATKFCPHCLHEDLEDPKRVPGTKAYGRIQWGMPCVSTCVRHNVELARIDRLIKCSDRASCSGELWAPHDFGAIIEVGRNGMLHTDPVAFAASEFEHFVVDRLHGKKHHGALLDTLSLPAAIETAQLLGLANLFGRKFDWQNVDPTTLRQAQTGGYRILSGEEAAMRVMLESFAQNIVGRRGSLSSIYGTLFEVISRRSHDYQPIKTILRDHAADFVSQRDHSSSKAGKPTTTSIIEIASKVQMTPRTVARYLVQKGYLSSLPTDVGRLTVDVDIARKAVEALRDAASFTDMQEVFGCSIAELRCIARSGLLTPVIGPIPNDAKAGIDRYSRSEMLAFRKSLGSGSHRSGDDMISLREASLQTGIPVGEILKAACNSEICNWIYSEESPVFSGFRLDPTELLRTAA